MVHKAHIERIQIAFVTGSTSEKLITVIITRLSTAHRKFHHHQYL